MIKKESSKVDRMGINYVYSFIIKKIDLFLEGFLKYVIQ